MVKTRRTGSTTAIRQPLGFSFDPRTGFQNEIPYRGSPEACLGYAAQLTQAGIAYRYHSEGATAEVTIVTAAPVDGSDEKPIDNWQLLGNEIQKDLKEHPLVLDMESAWPGTIGYIVRDIDLYNQGKPSGSPAPDPSAMAAGGSFLFDLLKRGTDHFPLGQYVLRHTRTISDQYTKDIDDDNPETLYTTDQLIAECTDSELQKPLPGRLVNKINNIPKPSDTDHYLWSWRKLPSTESTVAGNRIEVVTEYWLELWSTFIYPTLTA